MKNQIKYLIVLLAVGIISCSACSTYKPIEADKLAEYPECVLTMNMFKAYEKVGEKSGVVLPSDACLTAIKRQRCVREVWNKQAADGYWMPDWDDSTGVANYNACMSRK